MRKKLLSLTLISMYIITIIMGSLTQVTYAENTNMLMGETPSGIAFEDLENAIDDYVTKYIGKTTPGAAIAVVKNGEVILLKGYGYADVENKIPVDPNQTVFEWGSISKLFTWTSIMQLVEHNKLNLDESISTYLPNDFYDALNLEQTITLRDIMNHSAGFGNYAFNTVAFTENEVVPLDKAILRDQPKQYYKVGTASAYSNYATSIAGFIVQNISGKLYEEYQRENIFNVLSMNNTTAYTTYDDKKEMLKVKAEGYMPTKDGFKLGNGSFVSHRPAGSFSGTTEDFTKYIIALTPDTDENSPLFKSRYTLDTMLSPSYDKDGQMVGTSHGFFEYNGESPGLGHGGNTAAFSSQFAMVPDERFGFVILTNAYHEMNILFGLHDLLIGKKDSSIDISDQIFPSSEEVIGHYVPMDRQEGNFVNFINYINLYKVKSTDENTITLNIGPYQGTYVQTEPYHYELIDDNMPIFRNAYPILKFIMDEGSVSQIIVGHGLDLSALPSGRTMPILISSMIVILISTLYFFILPIVLLIILIRSKKKQLSSDIKKLYLYQLLLGLCGAVTIINNLIPPAKVMINNFRTFAELRPYLIFNYPLILCSIAMAIITLIQMRKLRTKKCRGLYIATVTILSLLYAVLICWNFFAIVG